VIRIRNRHENDRDCTAASPEPVLEVMNFLNEVAADYPRAVSFASGRPSETLFRDDLWTEAPSRFMKHLTGLHHGDANRAAKLLAQYGRTGGLINDLIAEQLRRDEGLACVPEQIVVTAGCQEAILLCLQALCTGPADVVLVRNPTYIGITGAAHYLDVKLLAVEPAFGERFSDRLASLVSSLNVTGSVPRALYLTPDFDNPTGSVLPIEERRAILEICSRSRIAVLEDNPYGMFCYDGDRLPTMAAIDEAGVVIYMSTYSKTICPALRVGCAVVPPRLFGSWSESRSLVTELIQRKSFLTVNTSQFNQAVVGGVLLLENCSLGRCARQAADHYRHNRNAMLASLERAFSIRDCGIEWNRPGGGFFLTLSLPFTFGRREVLACAEDYQVLPMPMSFFSLSGSSHTNSVRLAFSNVEQPDIEIGIDRLAQYVRKRLVA
jgi:(S)-3,5-dihydroxyphenylglycine transaminase